MKTKQSNEKLVECPQCLGLGLVYEPNIEKDEKCTMCKGKGKVKESIADEFDPLKDLDNLNIEDYE